MILFIPIRTRTPGNSRRHWRKDWTEAKEQRQAARLMVQAWKDRPPFPVKVMLTRCSPRVMDRHNVPGAMKHIIDGIADAYGVDDGDPRWEFVFHQRKQSLYGVEILIEGNESDE